METVRVTHLGNVTERGKKMSNTAYYQAQEAMKNRFVSDLKVLAAAPKLRSGPIKLRVYEEEVMNEGYRIVAVYESAVSQEYRNLVQQRWRKVKIESKNNRDEFFLPFGAGPDQYKKMWDVLVVGVLILIMLVCLYMEMLNKPMRYGFPPYADAISGCFIAEEEGAL